MSNARTLIAAIVITLITPAVPSEAPSPATSTGSPASIEPGSATRPADRGRGATLPTISAATTVHLDGATVYAENQAQLETVEWSLRRYADHGLELPHVTVEMRSIGKCPTPDGRQLSGSLAIVDGEYRITVCGERRTLLHELGHVWDKHNLTDEIRDRFMELRGVGSWRHDAWHLAGGEHAAETMTWALDSMFLPPSRIPNRSTAALAAGFELLTGMAAPVLEIAPPIAAEPTLVGDREILDAGVIEDGKNMG
jgi:hypothetical protein